MISHDLNDKGAKCFAQSPTNLAVKTFVMSCAEKERCFYDVCLYSTKHNIRNYPIKLFFDIERKDENGIKMLLSDEVLDMVFQVLYNTVYDVLRKYYA